MVDDFAKMIESQGWDCVLKDGGQPHFIGWGFHYRWQKDAESNQVDLHFADNQGKQSCHLEMSLPAFKLLDESLQPFLITVTDE